MDSNYFITAIFGLVGTLVGAGVSFLANILQTSNEAKIRIREKIFDKRIHAYEEILSFCQLMRTTVTTHTGDKENNTISYPIFLHDRESYSNFKGKFLHVLSQNSFWVGIELLRYLNYVQDYTENLSTYIKDIEDKKLSVVAIVVKQDFIEMAVELEKVTSEFFETDIYNINLRIKKGHHKFAKEKTVSKLQATHLFKNIKIIQSLSLKK